MYSSLSRADAVTRLDDGTQLAVQTDHRNATEIERTREVSTVFALTRAFNPYRLELDAVRYVLFHEPPAWFVEVLAAGGCGLEIALEPRRAPSTPDIEAINALVGPALANLGQAVHRQHGFTLDLAGIKAAEQHYAGLGLSLDDEEQEIESWTAVTELAAFCGEVLRGAMACQWALSSDADSTVPFMLRTDDADGLNVFTRSERALRFGPEHGPSTFYAPASQPAARGPIMMSLKPGNWPNREAVHCHPLLSQPADEPDMPVLTYGIDLPEQFAYFRRGEETRSFHELAGLAASHLANIEVDISPIGDDILLVVHDDYYASEKLLDAAFMRTLHARLDAPMLLASVPLKSRLLVTNAMRNDDPVQSLADIYNITHAMAGEDAEQRLSTTIFTVSDGQLAGVARPTLAD